MRGRRATSAAAAPSGTVAAPPADAAPVAASDAGAAAAAAAAAAAGVVAPCAAAAAAAAGRVYDCPASSCQCGASTADAAALFRALRTAIWDPAHEPLAAFYGQYGQAACNRCPSSHNPVDDPPALTLLVTRANAGAATAVDMDGAASGGSVSLSAEHQAALAAAALLNARACIKLSAADPYTCRRRAALGGSGTVLSAVALLPGSEARAVDERQARVGGADTDVLRPAARDCGPHHLTLFGTRVLISVDGADDASWRVRCRAAGDAARACDCPASPCGGLRADSAALLNALRIVVWAPAHEPLQVYCVRNRLAVYDWSGARRKCCRNRSIAQPSRTCEASGSVSSASASLQLYDSDEIGAGMGACTTRNGACAMVEVGGNLLVTGTQGELVAAEVVLPPGVHYGASRSASDAIIVFIAVAHIAPVVADRGVQDRRDTTLYACRMEGQVTVTLTFAAGTRVAVSC
ncbi:hypothetical protein JKP88DRAFT_282467 [Tribonema minus]|uniref:Uncharacterized protein n=1 Tax=Tribonema minus TaxID=303371 RepID=A0A835YLX1_9STRA|nr:hypothetical protein JKP88DRAFT_282467 [Tribonema minus]